MEETYEGNGVRFRYPALWELVEQEDEESTSITVASPERRSGRSRSFAAARHRSS